MVLLQCMYSLQESVIQDCEIRVRLLSFFGRRVECIFFFIYKKMFIICECIEVWVLWLLVIGDKFFFFIYIDSQYQ